MIPRLIFWYNLFTKIYIEVILHAILRIAVDFERSFGEEENVMK